MSDTIVAQVETATTGDEINNSQHHEDFAASITPDKKRGGAALKLDVDGNPLPNTPRKTATPKSKLDADGNPVPKTPRKTAAAKQLKVDADEIPITETPKKSVSKAKAEVKTETSQEEGNGVNSSAAVDNIEEVTPPATPTSKKRANKVAADAETTSKRAKSTSVKGNAIPSNKADLTEADRMLMDWRESGKSWSEIKTEYARFTGKPVGNSTLPNRYIRLKASLVELKDGDMELVLYAKDLIAQEQVIELEAYKKKQETEAWARIATKIVGVGADAYTGDTIAKAYIKEKQAGFPHRQTDRYTAIMSNGPEIYQDSQDVASPGNAETKHDVGVDLHEDGNPVYTENTEEKTTRTVIQKKELHTDVPVKGFNGSRKGSLAEILSECTSGKSTTQEDDGVFFN